MLSVVALICASNLHSLALRDPRVRMRITLDSSSLVPWFVPSAFRDVSGVDLEWHKINEFRRNSSNRERVPKIFCPTEFLRQFFCNSTLNLLRELSDKSLLSAGTALFCSKLLLRCSSHFSLLRAASFGLSLKVAILYGKEIQHYFKTALIIIFY